MRELIRIGTSYSHTRILKVMSIICRFAYDHDGEIIPTIDLSKIDSKVVSEIGQKYRRKEAVYNDYLKTSEAMGLLSTRKVPRYRLTDYGLLAVAGLDNNELSVFPLTSFEKAFYLQLLMRKDIDYLVPILSALHGFPELVEDALDVLFSDRSRLGPLIDIRSIFRKELSERIEQLHLAAEGMELRSTISRWERRTLNHRVSSRLFWLVEILSERELVMQDKEKAVQTFLRKTERLRDTLLELDFSFGSDLVVDEQFPRIYLKTHRQKPGREVNESLIQGEILNTIEKEWDRYSKLEPDIFGNRISALPFLLTTQIRLVLQNVEVPLSRIRLVFQKRMPNRGFILVWRDDFHSGFIERNN